ncbi:MAG: hypothetical protein ABL894_08060 [Hyphomicrobium sp.]
MNYARRTPLPHKMDVADFIDWPGDGTGTLASIEAEFPLTEAYSGTHFTAKPV